MCCALDDWPSPQVPCWVCVSSWLALLVCGQLAGLALVCGQLGAVWPAACRAGQGRALDDCQLGLSLSVCCGTSVYHVSVPVFQGGTQIAQEAGPFDIPCSGCSSGVVLELAEVVGVLRGLVWVPGSSLQSAAGQ